ncbi:MAG TPA: hydrogenase subunit MbhD domain-containing protein [Mycobacteriales bacterium]|jgi:uncharacterized MnhB-related membrane protein|nr:hydrogenase subunit MbhD domain-containing protein [Mycobacteriales bacterium]
MTVLIAILLVGVAAMAIAVVCCHDVRAQAVVLSGYGLLLALLFTALQAPDVALSQLAVGTVVTPMLLLLAVVKVRGR